MNADTLLPEQQSRLPPSFQPFEQEDLDSFPYTDLQNVRPLNSSAASVGQFSTMMLAEYKNTGRTVAVKTLNFEDNREVYAFVELALLRNLRDLKHSAEHGKGGENHVIDFVGALKVENKIVMVTEFMERGDVKKALRLDLPFFRQQIHASDLDFVWKQRVRVIKHVAMALQELHQFNIVHRDIKNENLFLTGRGRKMICKLGDFGFARGIHDISEEESRTYTVCGTDELMAPEMLQCLPYDHSVDIYSFGFVIVELICGRGPTPINTEDSGSPHNLPMPSEPDHEVVQLARQRTVDSQKRATVDYSNYGGNFLLRLAKDSFDVEFKEVEDCVLAGCPVELVTLAEQCLSFESKYRISAEDLVMTIVELESELNERKAERVPSKVPPKKWIYDKQRKNFTSQANSSSSSPVQNQASGMQKQLSLESGTESMGETKVMKLKQLQGTELTLSRSKVTSVFDLVESASSSRTDPSDKVHPQRTNGTGTRVFPRNLEKMKQNKTEHTRMRPPKLQPGNISHLNSSTRTALTSDFGTQNTRIPTIAPLDQPATPPHPILRKTASMAGGTKTRTTASVVSKYSKTNNLANVARRQLRAIARTLSHKSNANEDEGEERENSTKTMHSMDVDKAEVQSHTSRTTANTSTGFSPKNPKKVGRRVAILQQALQKKNSDSNFHNDQFRL